MRPWQFKQKTPGFGISRNYYLSVLAATAQLPSLLEVVEPNGANGSVEGFGVPLAAGAQKADVTKRLERGMYGIASKNKQTVLRLVVIPKEEAGYDPEPFLRSLEARLLTPEHLARIGATWFLLQLTFETHEPMVYGSLKFLQGVAVRLALLTNGIVSDPISRSYLLPDQVCHRPALDERIDVRDHVRVWHSPAENGWTYTLGLQKFALSEYEMFGVPSAEAVRAEQLLLGLGQAALVGKIPRAGDVVGATKAPFQVATGGLDRKHWEGIDCFELIPPSGSTVCDALDAWAAETLSRS